MFLSIRKNWLIAALLLVSSLAFGQNVQITGTVEDSAGHVYAGGSGVVVLVPQNQTYTINGGQVQSPVSIAALDSFGHFSISLPSTALISPQSPAPQWQ